MESKVGESKNEQFLEIRALHYHCNSQEKTRKQPF